MSNNDNRVLIRKGARPLTQNEIDGVTGSSLPSILSVIRTQQSQRLGLYHGRIATRLDLHIDHCPGVWVEEIRNGKEKCMSNAGQQPGTHPHGRPQTLPRGTGRSVRRPDSNASERAGNGHVQPSRPKL